jgi:hypothetical protein
MQVSERSDAGDMVGIWRWHIEDKYGSLAMWDH